MEALKEGYQGGVKVKEVKLQNLRRDFENLKQNENESVGDYYVRVKSIVNKMDILSDEIDKDLVIKKVVRKLLTK